MQSKELKKNSLLNCPFCGGEVRLMSIIDDGVEICINYEDELDMDYSFVHCYNCDTDFMPHNCVARGVLENWNTRKPIERIVEQLEESMNEAKNLWDDDEYYTGQANAYEYAIEIVKGGVDNAE